MDIADLKDIGDDWLESDSSEKCRDLFDKSDGKAETLDSNAPEVRTSEKENDSAPIAILEPSIIKACESVRTTWSGPPLTVDVKFHETPVQWPPSSPDRVDTMACNRRFLATACQHRGVEVYRIFERSTRSTRAATPVLKRLAALACPLSRCTWLCLQPGASDVLVLADAEAIRMWRLNDVISLDTTFDMRSAHVIGERFPAINCCHLAETPSTMLAVGVANDVWLLDFNALKHHGTLYGLESRVYSVQITGNQCAATSVHGQVMVWSCSECDVLWTWYSTVPSPAVCVELHIPVCPSSSSSDTCSPNRHSSEELVTGGNSVESHGDPEQSGELLDPEPHLNSNMIGESFDPNSKVTAVLPTDTVTNQEESVEQGGANGALSLANPVNEPVNETEFVDLSAVAWASGRITILVTSQPTCPELITFSLGPRYSASPASAKCENSIVCMKAVRLSHGATVLSKPEGSGSGADDSGLGASCDGGRLQFGPHGLLLVLTGCGAVHVISTATWLSLHCVTLSHSESVNFGGIHACSSPYSLLLFCRSTLSGTPSLRHICLTTLVDTGRAGQQSEVAATTDTSDNNSVSALPSPLSSPPPAINQQQSQMAVQELAAKTDSQLGITVLSESGITDKDGNRTESYNKGSSINSSSSSSTTTSRTTVGHSLTAGQRQSASLSTVTASSQSHHSLTSGTSRTHTTRPDSSLDRSLSEILVTPEATAAPLAVNICTIADTQRSLSVYRTRIKQQQQHRQPRRRQQQRLSVAGNHRRKGVTAELCPNPSRSLTLTDSKSDCVSGRSSQSVLPSILTDYRPLAEPVNCLRRVNRPVLVYGGRQDRVTRLAVSGSGNRLACASQRSNTVEILKLTRSKCVPVLDKFLTGNHGNTVALSWTLDDERLLAAFDRSLLIWQRPTVDAAITEWQPASLSRSSKCCGGGGGRATGISDARFFYMDSFILAAVGSRVCVLKYDDSCMSLTGHCQLPCQQVVTTAAENRCSCPLVLAACSDRQLQLVDMSVARCVAQLSPPPPRRHCHRAQMCATLAATLCASDGVRVWDVRTCRLAHRLLISGAASGTTCGGGGCGGGGSSGGRGGCSSGLAGAAEVASISTFAFSPDGAIVAAGVRRQTSSTKVAGAGSEWSRLWLWDLRWPQVPTAQVHVAGGVSDLAFDPRMSALICAVGGDSLQSVYIQSGFTSDLRH